MSPTGNKNYNNLQDAGWPPKNLVRSVKESLLDSYRTANECRVWVDVRVQQLAEIANPDPFDTDLGGLLEAASRQR